MLDFIIIGLPRSGTTWAANWLTGDRVFCVHDPLWMIHYAELDQAVPARAGGRLAGVSCTGLWRWPHWLRGHPARKLVLHRDLDEVRQSLRAAGLPGLPPAADEALSRIDGEHVPWTDLFDPVSAARLWRWLTAGAPFDAERHAELAQVKVEPHLAKVSRDFHLNRRFARELAGAGEGVV